MKHAMVTGCDRGPGLHSAWELLKRGYDMAACYLRDPPAGSAAGILKTIPDGKLSGKEKADVSGLCGQGTAMVMKRGRFPVSWNRPPHFFPYGSARDYFAGFLTRLFSYMISFARCSTSFTERSFRASYTAMPMETCTCSH